MAFPDLTARIRCAVCKRIRGFCKCPSETPAQRAARYCEDHPNDQGCKIHEL